jgi:hypothetical protein
MLDKIILYFGILAIILGQSIGNDWQFYTGLYLFCSCSLYYISTKLSGLEARLMMFLCGISFYNVVKQLFEDVTNDSIFEYLSFFFGLLFLFLSNVKRDNN